MKFCKNCGHEVRDSAKICTNCGADINTEFTQEKPEKQAYVTADKEAAEQTPREPMDPKKKKKLIILFSIIAVLIIALFIVYKVFENKASPDSILDNIGEAVINQDAGAFQKAIDTDISKEEALAYFKYVDNEIGMSKYSAWINDQKIYLNEGAQSSEIYDGMHTLLTIVKDGSQYILFDDYKFTIPKSNVYIEGTGGVDSFKYEMDGDTIEWSTSDSKFNELIPGTYNISGTGILNESEEFDTNVVVNFAEYQGDITGDITGDFYYVEFNIPSLYMYSVDIKSDDISLTLNGEPFAEEVDFDTDQKTGPLRFDEEYVIEGTLAFKGEDFKMDSVTLNLNSDSDELYYDYDSIAHHMMDINFDEDALYDQSVKVSEQEEIESQRDSFEENLEDYSEDLVSNYLYGLESMYLMDDISYVEDYLTEDSSVLNTLQDNLDNGSFGNMDIQSETFSNYSKDGNTITIDAKTKRIHDDIDDPVTYSTRYTIVYDPDTLELKIANFADL